MIGLALLAVALASGFWAWFAPNDVLIILCVTLPFPSLMLLAIWWVSDRYDLFLCPGGMIFRSKRRRTLGKGGGLLIFPWRRLSRVVHVVDGTSGATSHLTLTRDDTARLRMSSLQFRELEGVLQIIRSEAERRGIHWETEVWTPNVRGVERCSLDSREQREFYEERDGL
jgi:hypothetical protein